MKLENKYATDLTSKDRNVALAAAKHIIDTSDMDAWRCFVEHSDNIFDFIKQNIGKYFSEVINEDNYKNLYKLFKIHSFDWDECFIQILLRFSYANEELHNKMLDLIEHGSEDEKAYAAKYFSFIPDGKANTFLFDSYKTNYEPLKYNAAKALGDACDMYSYNYFQNGLASEDDWEKIDAAQFLQWYGNKKAYAKMLEAMENSTMPEHIAGYIAMLDNISHHFTTDDEVERNLSLCCYQYIIESLAEIWPLSTIIDFELYDCVETIIHLINDNKDNDLVSRLCVLILKTKYQFEMFNSDEYKYEEDKHTLEAMDGILELLGEATNDFWRKCTAALENEISQYDEKRVILALTVISDFKLSAYIPKIKEMLNKNYPERIIYEVILTLGNFRDFNGVNKQEALNKISDYNLKISAEKMFV
ncbi:MAG: hypothetical protein K6A44_00060 [bacterium]|nr:hypothetical protein [bacterium]